MMKQRYESYKPSGIDWIGEIPSHWNMSTVGKHYQVILGKMLCPKPLDATYTLEEYYCAGDVHFDGVNGGNLKQMWFSPEEKEKYIVKKSDLLIVEGGAGAGGCAVVSKKAENDRYIQNSILIARHSQNSTVFLKYLIETLVKAGYIDRECNEATFSHFTKEKVCHVPYPVIPILEQQEIAAWLDKKCGEIDSAIAKVDREIELIDELKQSEISRVVTRGLNPDAPLRPSGIDWIGDVPEHWEKCRFKNFMYLKVNPSVAETKVGLENLEPGSGKYIETDTEFEGNGIAFTFGDILYGKLRPYLRKVWLAEFEGNAVGDFFVFRNHNNSNITFIKYLLLSDGFTKQADGSTFGAKMPRVSSEFILTLPYFLPPLSEQKEIADYLDKKCAEIDGLKEKLVKKRETLKELRQAVISEVVTGKRKVI